MTLYINGSPKLKSSNSEYFLNLIDRTSTKVYLYKDSFENIDFKSYTTIVISFPLYLDSPPSKVIELMEYIKNSNIDIAGIHIYEICNCGFLESNQNICALKILENFCKQSGASYKGSFLIGAGEIAGKCGKIKPYKLLNISLFIKMYCFKRCIKKKKEMHLKTTIHPMSKYLYIILANSSWKRKQRE